MSDVPLAVDTTPGKTTCCRLYVESICTGWRNCFIWCFEILMSSIKTPFKWNFRFPAAPCDMSHKSKFFLLQRGSIDKGGAAKHSSDGRSPRRGPSVTMSPHRRHLHQFFQTFKCGKNAVKGLQQLPVAVWYTVTRSIRVARINNPHNRPPPSFPKVCRSCPQIPAALAQRQQTTAPIFFILISLSPSPPVTDLFTSLAYLWVPYSWK